MRASMGSISSSFTNVRSASSWFELYAAFSTFMMLLRTVINDLIPHQIRSLIASKLKAFFSDRQGNNQVSLHINQYWDGQTNKLFLAAQEYLPSRISHSFKSLKVGKISKRKNVLVAVDGTQEVVDHFQDIKLMWKLVEETSNKDSGDRDRYPKSSHGSEKHSFKLSFDEKHRDVIMSKYIPHVLSTYEAMQAAQKTIKIHSIGGKCWRTSDLTHPASFDSLALDPEQKQAIIGDLDRFLRRKELYKKVGKPWKRGYLLYGPPGTGKSSLIAAMANHLKFDIYDLELSSVYSNSELMRVLSETSNRSIIVIEDIDCNKQVHVRPTSIAPPDSDSDSDYDRKHVKVKTSRLTLSGLLNYMDGLWSSGGEERIIIFTTNHRERIDPALLRPGRMDMHIHLSFLKGKAFRILASTYLGIEGHHPRFEEIDELLEKIEVTPAVVAEQLMRNEDPEDALAELDRIYSSGRVKRANQMQTVEKEEQMPYTTGCHNVTQSNVSNKLCKKYTSIEEESVVCAMTMGSNTYNMFSSFTSASSWFELYAAFSTFMMLFKTAFNDLIPQQFRTFITSKLESFFSRYQPNNHVSLKINQFWDETSRNRNELFYAAHEYLPNKITSTFKSLKVGKLEDQKHLELAVDATQEVVDDYEGVKFTWKLDDGSEKDSENFKKYSFELTFNERYRDRALDRYIPHVLKTYEAMKSDKKILKIYSRLDGYWTESELSHPATFKSLALSPELKKDIIDDLDRFLRRKELYKKVGKPWKRGYLLYGPPGTGKSSLIAAIANYLKFDVYDLELTSVYSNSDLMRSMKEASNRSIIVVEDVDCNKVVHVRSNANDQDSDSDSEGINAKAKTNRFTLSGLLNYMDGLWSSGGEERIVIFTTNHKEKIDPALLRPGRMDMHIHLSFLKGKAFRVLASNYLGIEGDHPLFEEIEGLLEQINVTPALVAEQLIRNADLGIALEELAKFLKEREKDSNCNGEITELLSHSRDS
ncbi:hypothetical protein Fmac_002558 [Flemingia macrophylla]|uniref:AAA+ ATPase domain-containing protein n=1 Tax=Flemingia macrophylla TaxID=520843 RepID=A0ABD1NLZ0_9FABA